MRKIIAAVLFFIPTIVFSAQQEPLKPAQRAAEEKRIQQEIEHNLDWKNRDPQKLDQVEDNKRLLYAFRNESVLIDKNDRVRFGLFEFINKEKILSYEIRFHKKNILTARFDLIFERSDCVNGVGLSVDENTRSGFVMNFSCTNRNNANTEFFYFFHKESGKLFRLIQIDDEIRSGPKTKESNGRYVIRWKLKPGGMLSENLIMKFEIQKKNGKWKIETTDGPVEGDPAFEVDKLPLDHKYDLPDVINWDQ